MALSANQLKLIQALAENKIEDAKKYAVCCCAEDTTKKNSVEIRRCTALLKNTNPKFMEIPANLAGCLQMEDVSDFREDRYYLGKKEKEIFQTIEQTNKVSLRLLELGIPYLNSTLLYGEPGTGKTMFGKYVAYKLGLPFAYVNFSYLIDSLMGGTSKKLQKVFEFCKGRPCVLMLDEFDCIGLKRANSSEGSGGELARTTISLMQALDSLTNEQIVIAATNRFDRIDPALTRRFFQHQELTIFNADERAAMAYKFLDAVGVDYDKKEIENYTERKCTQADIIKFATQIVIRNIVQEENA